MGTLGIWGRWGFGDAEDIGDAGTVEIAGGWGHRGHVDAEAAGTLGWGDLGDAGTGHAGTPGIWGHEGLGDMGDLGTWGMWGHWIWGDLGMWGHWRPRAGSPAGATAHLPPLPAMVGLGAPRSPRHAWVLPGPGDIVRQRASPRGAEAWCARDAGGPTGCHVGWHHARVLGTPPRCHSPALCPLLSPALPVSPHSQGWHRTQSSETRDSAPTLYSPGPGRGTGETRGHGVGTEAERARGGHGHGVRKKVMGARGQHGHGVGAEMVGRRGGPAWARGWRGHEQKGGEGVKMAEVRQR